MKIINLRHWLLIRWGYPIILFFGRILPGFIDKWEKDLIQLNNRLILSKKYKVTYSQLLLLLPHCLQNVDCEHRITYNILNCAHCGKCTITEIIKLGEKYNLTIKVATGGRLAQRWVQEYKPDLIIACACEHELADGISAVYPLKVLAIPNERPEGPCRNTTAKVEEIEKMIKLFLKI